MTIATTKDGTTRPGPWTIDAPIADTGPDAGKSAKVRERRGRHSWRGSRANRAATASRADSRPSVTASTA